MGREWNWIAPCGALAGFQLLFALLLSRTYTPASAPLVFAYGARLFAFAFVAATVMAGLKVRSMALSGVKHPTRELLRAIPSARAMALPIGFALLTLHISTFTWAKPILPMVGGFWADPLLADLDRSVFGTDPWPALAAALGGANGLLDIIYQAWFPVVIAAFFYVLALEASAWRSRALIAFFLTWTAGMLFQFLLPSAGPVFYERVGFGARFAGIDPPYFAWLGSEYLWKYHTGEEAGMAVGISAMPSMHVAVATWLWLSLRRTRARYVAAAFLAAISVGSVSLGWHYAVDGIVGASLACAAWALSGVASARPLSFRLPFPLQRPTTEIPGT